jgi:creatinine amidohydrolase
MSDMTWVDYAERLAKPETVIYLPVGAVEQHGPHLPLGTDWMLALAVAKGAAAPTSGIVASPLTYGYKSQCHSGGGNHFAGTTSLDGHTLSSLVCDVLREFARHGARQICIVDIHFENHWFITEGCDLASRELQRSGHDDVRIIKPRLDAICDMDMIMSFYEPGTFPGMALEHAGKAETSIMLYLHPEYVRTELYPEPVLADVPPYDEYPINPEGVPETGVLAPVADASVEMGQALYQDLVDGFIRCVKSAF